jgi:hypothetical protein
MSEIEIQGQQPSPQPQAGESSVSASGIEYRQLCCVIRSLSQPLSQAKNKNDRMVRANVFGLRWSAKPLALMECAYSGTLLGRDGGEGGPALLDSPAAAVRADDFAILILGKRQHLRECFLAGVAEELVVRHWDLRVVVKGSD